MNSLDTQVKWITIHRGPLFQDKVRLQAALSNPVRVTWSSHHSLHPQMWWLGTAEVPPGISPWPYPNLPKGVTQSPSPRRISLDQFCRQPTPLLSHKFTFCSSIQACIILGESSGNCSDLELCFCDRSLKCIIISKSRRQRVHRDVSSNVS